MMLSAQLLNIDNARHSRISGLSNAVLNLSELEFRGSR
jgi:hypothetical protein